MEAGTSRSIIARTGSRIGPPGEVLFRWGCAKLSMSTGKGGGSAARRHALSRCAGMQAARDGTRLRRSRRCEQQPLSRDQRDHVAALGETDVPFDAPNGNRSGRDPAVDPELPRRNVAELRPRERPVPPGPALGGLPRLVRPREAHHHARDVADPPVRRADRGPEGEGRVRPGPHRRGLSHTRTASPVAGPTPSTGAYVHRLSYRSGEGGMAGNRTMTGSPTTPPTIDPDQPLGRRCATMPAMRKFAGPKSTWHDPFRRRLTTSRGKLSTVVPLSNSVSVSPLL